MLLVLVATLFVGLSVAKPKASPAPSGACNAPPLVFDEDVSVTGFDGSETGNLVGTTGIYIGPTTGPVASNANFQRQIFQIGTTGLWGELGLRLRNRWTSGDLTAFPDASVETTNPAVLAVDYSFRLFEGDPSIVTNRGPATLLTTNLYNHFTSVPFGGDPSTVPPLVRFGLGIDLEPSEAFNFVEYDPVTFLAAPPNDDGFFQSDHNLLNRDLSGYTKLGPNPVSDVAFFSGLVASSGFQNSMPIDPLVDDIDGSFFTGPPDPNDMRVPPQPTLPTGQFDFYFTYSTQDTPGVAEYTEQARVATTAYLVGARPCGNTESCGPKQIDLLLACNGPTE